MKNKKETLYGNATRVAEIVRQRERAIRIKSLCYRIGGAAAMSVWNVKDCPKHLRWLWKICSDAQSDIQNLYVDLVPLVKVAD